MATAADMVLDPPHPFEQQSDSRLKESPDQGPEEPQEFYYELVVSDDKLKAYLCARGEGASSLTIEDVKKFLKAQGICYGLVEDRRIGEYINRGLIFKEPCLIAVGKPSEPGRDAQVTYHFEKDPLKSGSIRTGGAIDFKNKGEIPQVKEGALLTEKIPLVKEKPGVDVYSQPIPVEPAKDILLVPGPGAKKSADGLKIYAKASGRPEFLSDGKLGVFPELKIPGDVGLETGHIRFDGSVDVGGTIQEGFRVKAGRLAAREIHRAEVEVEGDIVVNGGIIGARVSCKGNLKARFIQSSIIETWGDVIVEREVIDSQIKTHGAVIGKLAGKIFSSRIMATKGVVATQIGSESSNPCVLTIGIDSHVKNMLKKMQEEISHKEEEQKRIKTSIEVLNQALYRLKEDIVKWIQIQDRGTIEQRSHRKLIAELKEKNDLSSLAGAQRELGRIEEKIRNADESLQNLVAREEQAVEKISTLHLQLKKLDETIQGICGEMEKTMGDCWEKEPPPIKVLGQVFQGTILEGRHGKLVLKENLKNVLIQEIPNNDLPSQENLSTPWIIRVFPFPEAVP